MFFIGTQCRTQFLIIELLEVLNPRVPQKLHALLVSFRTAFTEVDSDLMIIDFRF